MRNASEAVARRSPFDDEDDVFIWWTSHRDMIQIRTDDAQHQVSPQVEADFGVRARMVGGRKCFTTRNHVHFDPVDWDTSKPAYRLIRDRVGIIMDREGARSVYHLPGFLTDNDLNVVNFEPQLAAGYESCSAT